MELALSLGDTPKGLSINLDKATTTRLGNKDPFFIALGDANHSNVNRLPVGVEEAEDGTPVSSSPNSVSSFQMEFCIRNSMVGSRNKREHEGEGERDCSRGSDDEDNGSTRKKLRLSKEQSAFLEESFKEHTTLNPKQKLALAKQLNLRPRQVEVWFQNRRARTKLKQTEVDCEYLKRCCETLTEENRRLQKELQELRALKTSQPFYMQLPATTLTMCPSCERLNEKIILFGGIDYRRCSRLKFECRLNNSNNCD
ncbi:homeobox-leucine zipper protein HOX11-like [Senna tora]|uniref:Homeobox-leucine zipper protein HOX11-like n=1 Tax=Senna tora TaxID=362788 RepID=A0A834W380_9FABA|nr:homeobox-leucine zipper protein HOX11-like [Senna tora]